MKNKTKIIAATLLALLFLPLCALRGQTGTPPTSASSAFVADAPNPGPNGPGVIPSTASGPAAVVVATDPAISADVQNGITGFLNSTPWGAKLLAVLILLNLIGPPICDAIHNTILWTATKEDDEFEQKVEQNTVFRWFVYLVRIFGVKAHPSQD
ncbi:MAG TPA: hypothetical protein VHH73_20245 [Verrucomicrobiae bacterium]|nr:hypothetical protein [Verrucomicrobiae bacterium]